MRTREIDLGLPGALPVLNESCRNGRQFGCATSAEIMKSQFSTEKITFILTCRRDIKLANSKTHCG